MTITDVPHTSIEQMMTPGTARRHSLRGFDEDYVDIVDYIVRCTHKIWEEHNVGEIYYHYAHNILIHTSDGQTYGRDKVIADSLKTMAAFPDLRLFADDVIWTGDDEQGFHTSHRIVWVGHNTGYSIYGPPTGRRVVRRGIAHCLVKENNIVEEWICRDELSLVRQLGFDEHALARKFAEAQAASSGAQTVGRGEVERRRGQLPPAPVPTATDEDNVGDFVRRVLHEVWNWRMLGKINEYYVPNYECFTSSNRNLYGLGDFRAYLLALLAAFPDAALTVDHQCWLGDEVNGYRVATRWTLQGTHSGPGLYGEPTGKPIQIIGITHHTLRNGRFVREWTCFDEFALLKQLYWPM